MINRHPFFAKIRYAPFSGWMKTSQVEGVSKILIEWERRGLSDLRWLSYMLATALHETAQTMQPIEENLYYSASGLLSVFPKYFSASEAAAYAHQPSRIANRAYANRMGNGDEASGDGYRFRGRGLPQTTGRSNYEKFSTLVGVDLVAEPDQALDPVIAVRMMFDGMIDGMFTGHKLADYFNQASTSWIAARHIINGSDRASLIANYAIEFNGALKLASAPPVVSA